MLLTTEVVTDAQKGAEMRVLVFLPLACGGISQNFEVWMPGGAVSISSRWKRSRF